MKLKDITVTNVHNGTVHLMAMNGNHLMTRRYDGYTVREAKRLFLNDANSHKE